MSDHQSEPDQKQHLHNLRHTTEHVLTMAMHKLYGKDKVIMAMGPATEEGFYFDFDSPADFKISEENFAVIEAEMQKIIAADLQLERVEISIPAAQVVFAGNSYKQEWLTEIEAKKEPATVYMMGSHDQLEHDKQVLVELEKKIADNKHATDSQAVEIWSFIDLCSGPHVERTSEIKAFKLLSVAGAYWHGDEKNKMLTRVYGTAFTAQTDLDQYLWQREEAKKRDHRKLGRELELFFIDDMVGKGLIMWLPKGTVVRDQIEQLARETEEKAGYVRVVTPHIAKEELYLTSGHLPYYKDSMYPPMVMDDGTYYMKAMNCPHHHRIFGHKPRTYRELPLRVAEYGTCYRNELSGTLSGLLRVRALAMNDAHIYCRREQIKQEFKGVMEMIQEYFKLFGLQNYWFRLSKWDPKHTEKYINQPENWEYSQQVIREVLQEMKVPFVEADDEAAFYGPKVDVQFKSVIGREETMSTVQLDFLARERFGLEYVDEKGEQNNEVFVIHRAPLSVHERFMAFLLEHYAGAFPTWLAPVQAVVLPIADRHNEYAQQVKTALRAKGVRVEVDDRSERLNAKIRDAQLQKVPYMLVVGDKEAEAQTVTVRQRSGGEQLSLGLEAFSVQIHDEIANRKQV